MNAFFLGTTGLSLLPGGSNPSSSQHPASTRSRLAVAQRKMRIFSNMSSMPKNSCGGNTISWSLINIVVLRVTVSSGYSIESLNCLWILFRTTKFIYRVALFPQSRTEILLKLVGLSEQLAKYQTYWSRCTHERPSSPFIIITIIIVIFQLGPLATFAVTTDMSFLGEM